MSVLREPRGVGPVPARELGAGNVLISGPSGRVAVLSAKEHAVFVAGRALDESLRKRLTALGIGDGADPGMLARDFVSSGLLNWSGPGAHVLIVSSAGALMTPQTARAAIDFIFATPRPALHLEISDEDGRGWPTAWFAIEYARRKSEWGKRGLMMTYRCASAPARDKTDFLSAHGAALMAAFDVSGSPHAAGLFPAASARAVLGARPSGPESWVDAMAERGYASVRWVPDPAGARHAAAFMARALSRMIDIHETSDLRDERALALLSARPWDVPGVDLLQTLAYSPDGRVFTSEEAWSRAEGAFLLGPVSTLRFEELPSHPVVSAIAAAAWRPVHPLCDACAYRSRCALPASSPGALRGAVSESLYCGIHMALLDVVFARLNDEKCLNALIKWGIDTAYFSC